MNLFKKQSQVNCRERLNKIEQEIEQIEIFLASLRKQEVNRYKEHKDCLLYMDWQNALAHLPKEKDAVINVLIQKLHGLEEYLGVVWTQYFIEEKDCKPIKKEVWTYKKKK